MDGTTANALNANLEATADLKEFSFSWSGAIRARDFTLNDRHGELIASVKELAVDLSLWKAIHGEYIADVHIEEPVFVLRRAADGTFNVQNLAKPAPPAGPEPPKEPSAPKEKKADKLPVVIAKLVLTIVEFVRQLLERQAIRRMDGGGLTDAEVERVGMALMRLEEKVGEMAARFGLAREELRLGLGPLGQLL
jgi:uncharacterized protein involved in outer membrane biogenesis